MGILGNFFRSKKKTEQKITEIFYEEFEETLIESDIGPKTTQMILDHLHKGKTDNYNDVTDLLKKYLIDLVKEGELINTDGLKIILFTGINGVGKTTSLAKCAHFLKNKNYKVKVVAGDTFRAAAI
ncbi:MAG: signal recognition particle receptor subunit alpha, partial [Spirochaetes bacterium]|nr:signal recognition particle receptor subunit alpha [Spirochaetota bacterium]